MLRALAYLVGAVAVTAMVHAYVHRRLVHDTELSGHARARARAAVWALAALLPLGMVGLLTMRTAPRAVQTPLMACAFTWVGSLGFLLPLLLVGDAVRAVAARRDELADPARRRALSRLVGIASGAATLGLGGASAVVARLPLVVRRVRVTIPKLRPRGRPYRIVQISDVHAGATIGREWVESIVAEANALEPDLVAITGDLVDGSVDELREVVAPVARLRARDGVFFVTGNHEYLSGAAAWIEHVASLGARVLRNERVAIGGSGGFDLLGVDDPSGASWLPGHGTDLPAALRGRDPSRAAVLLAHRPDDVRDAVRGAIDLQISGHTHGGQIAPIGWALERLHQPYVYGLFRVGATALYVTSGAGYWGPPMRLATRAEIVLFELTGA